MFEENRHLSPSQILQKIQQLRLKEEDTNSPCDFDRQNKKSPCFFSDTDPENPQYIRYVLDYCSEFQDRGCVINKPQLLRKLTGKEFQDITFEMKNEYDFD